MLSVLGWLVATPLAISLTIQILPPIVSKFSVVPPFRMIMLSNQGIRFATRGSERRFSLAALSGVSA